MRAQPSHLRRWLDELPARRASAVDSAPRRGKGLLLYLSELPPPHTQHPVAVYGTPWVAALRDGSPVVSPVGLVCCTQRTCRTLPCLPAWEIFGFPAGLGMGGLALGSHVLAGSSPQPVAQQGGASRCERVATALERVAMQWGAALRASEGAGTAARS